MYKSFFNHKDFNVQCSQKSSNNFYVDRHRVLTV